MKIPAFLLAKHNLNPFLLGLVMFLALIVLSAFAGTTLFYLFALLISNHDPFFVLRNLPWVISALLVSAVIAGAVLRSPIWLFTRASFRFYGWASLCVISTAVLYCSIEKWRGRRIWAETVTEMSTHGEKPGLAFLNPTPVPEDQDAAKTPILLPLSKYEITDDGEFDWHDKPGYDRLKAIQIPISFFDSGLPGVLWMHQTPLDLEHLARVLNSDRDNLRPRRSAMALTHNATEPEPPESAITNYLARFVGDLDLVRAASQRPYARFKVGEAGMFSQATHQPIICNIANVLIVRAIARLHTGDTAEALEDVRCALRLGRLQNQVSCSPANDSGQTITMAALQAVWEGLARCQWSDSQLAALQDDLAHVTPLVEASRSARMWCWAYMDLINEIIPVSSARQLGLVGQHKNQILVKSIRLVYPQGWSYQDQAAIYRDYCTAMQAVDANNERIYPERLLDPQPNSLDPFFATLVHSGGMSKQFQHGVVVAALAQTGINFARIACALERYRLADGHYPENLEALTPRFMSKVPSDVKNGQPLCYRFTSDGRFVLSSLGNKHTTFGEIGQNAHLVDIPPDWFWKYPVRAMNRP